MSTETPVARTPVAPEVEERDLCFLRTPVFTVYYWQENGVHYAQPKELDLLAFTDDESALARELGSMITSLFLSLAEAEDRTESEEETLSLIGERLGPPLARYHERQRSSLFERVRSLVAHNLEWRVGPPSTPHGSLPALSG